MPHCIFFSKNRLTQVNNFTKSYTVPDGVPISDIQWGLAYWWQHARVFIQLGDEFKNFTKEILQIVFSHPELFENPGMTIQYNGDLGAGTITAEKNPVDYDWKVTLEEGYEEFDENDPEKAYIRLILCFSIVNDKAKGFALIDAVERTETDANGDDHSDYYKEYIVKIDFDATGSEKTMEVQADCNLEPLLDWYADNFNNLTGDYKSNAIQHFQDAGPKNMLMRVTQNGNDYTLTSSVYMETWDYWYDKANYGPDNGDTPLWDTYVSEKRRIYTIRARSDGTVARIDIAFPVADDNIFDDSNTPGKILQSNISLANVPFGDAFKNIPIVTDKSIFNQMFNSAFFTKDRFLGFYDGTNKLYTYTGTLDIGYCETNEKIYYNYNSEWYYFENSNWVPCTKPVNLEWKPWRLGIFEQASGIPPIMQTLYNSLDTSTIQPYTPTQVMELDITFP